VYSGKVVGSGMPVAVKVIKNSNVMLSREREFIRTEIAIARLVRHHNIVRTLDVFETSQNIYVVMEWVKGGDLLSKLLSLPNHRLPDPVAAKITRALLYALDYLHRHSIAHRDVKGENVLITMNKDGEVVDAKLTDFGLSAIAAHGNSMDAQLGTVEYAAPEIILKYAYDKSVDLWSLGVVTYVMLSGRLPFSGNSDRETALNIVKCKFAFVGDAWDPDAQEFIRRLLVRNPASRMTVQDALKHRWILKHTEFGGSTVSGVAGVASAPRVSNIAIPQSPRVSGASASAVSPREP
jgi:serine/threonine protein kinase